MGEATVLYLRPDLRTPPRRKKKERRLELDRAQGLGCKRTRSRLEMKRNYKDRNETKRLGKENLAAK